MMVVCQFLLDWYDFKAKDDSNKERRLKVVTDLMGDLKTEYEEE